MKRTVLSMLTLALIGVLLFAGCADADSPAESTTTTPQGSQPTSSLNAAAAAEQFYSSSDITLPDNFYRPDLIWNTGNLTTTKTRSDFRDSSDSGMYARGKLCRLIDFPSQIDKDAKYAIEMRIFLKAAEDPLVEYLTGKGWEVLDVPEDNDRIQTRFGKFFAATREQIEALDEKELFVYLGKHEDLTDYNREFAYGIDCTIAAQSLSVPVTPLFEYRSDLIWVPSVASITNESDRCAVLHFSYDNGGVSLPYFASPGTLECRFIDASNPSYIRPSDATKRFAVYFGYIDETPADWDALVAYLADLGYEEVGREGGFSVPVFAMTIEEIGALDCRTLQEVMGISDISGMDVMLSANTDEENDYSYHPGMVPWN